MTFMTYEDFLRQVQKDLQASFDNQKEESYSKVTIGIGNVNKIQEEVVPGDYVCKRGFPD